MSTLRLTLVAALTVLAGLALAGEGAAPLSTAGAAKRPAGATVPTMTPNVALESSAGMDGGMAWQSVFLLKDGRIASFGTGNHAPEQSNAVRIIDPAKAPGKVESYD